MSYLLLSSQPLRGMAVIVRPELIVVITLLQRKVRGLSRSFATCRRGRNGRSQKIIQSRHTLRFIQRVALLPMPNLPRENAKHFLLLAEGNPTKTSPSFHSSLHKERGEENILEGSNPQVLTHQLECPYKRIRVGIDLGRRQFRPPKNFPLKSGERQSKTHVFKDYLVH